MTASSREYDPLTVDALVQRYPVKGASTADLAQAAKKLHDRGLERQEIAEQLRISSRSVTRLIDTDVWPMGEIPEWAWREDWPLCTRGHEQTPDNVDRGGRCRMCPRGGPRPEVIVEGADHGTLKGYVHQRCRCNPCRAANAAQSRRRKEIVASRNESRNA